MDLSLATYVINTAITSDLPEPDQKSLFDTGLCYSIKPEDGVDLDHHQWEWLCIMIRKKESTPYLVSNLINPDDWFVCNFDQEGKMLSKHILPTRTISATIDGIRIKHSEFERNHIDALRQFLYNLVTHCRDYRPCPILGSHDKYHAHIGGPYVLQLVPNEDNNGIVCKVWLWLQKLHQLISHGELPGHLYVLYALYIRKEKAFQRMKSSIVLWSRTPLDEHTLTAKLMMGTSLTTELTEYQSNTLKWMLKMEQEAPKPISVPTQLTFGDDLHKFWFDGNNHTVRVGTPPTVMVNFKPGGLLNNTEGTGKTLILLALCMREKECVNQAKKPRISPLYHPGTLIFCSPPLMQHFVNQISIHTSLQINKDVLMLWNDWTLSSLRYSEILAYSIVIANIDLMETSSYNLYREEMLNLRPFHVLMKQQGILLRDFTWHRIIIDECWMECIAHSPQLSEKSHDFVINSDIRWLVSAAPDLGRTHCNSCNPLPLAKFAKMTDPQVYLNGNWNHMPSILKNNCSLTHLGSKVNLHSLIGSCIGEEIIHAAMIDFLSNRRLRLPTLSHLEMLEQTTVISLVVQREEAWLMDPLASKTSQQMMLTQFTILCGYDVKSMRYVAEHAHCLADHCKNVPCPCPCTKPSKTGELVLSVINEMENNVYPSCPVCMETIKLPVIAVAGFLACGHLLCRMCIMSMAIKPVNDEGLICPICRSPVKVISPPTFFLTFPDDCKEDVEMVKDGTYFAWLKKTLLAISSGIQVEDWLPEFDTSRIMPRVIVYAYNGVHARIAKRKISKQRIWDTMLLGRTANMNCPLSPKKRAVWLAFEDPTYMPPRMPVIFINDIDCLDRSSSLQEMKGLNFPATTHIIMYDLPPKSQMEKKLKDIKTMINRMDRPSTWPKLHIIIPHLQSKLSE